MKEFWKYWLAGTGLVLVFAAAVYGLSLVAGRIGTVLHNHRQSVLIVVGIIVAVGCGAAVGRLLQGQNHRDGNIRKVLPDSYDPRY